MTYYLRITRDEEIIANLEVSADQAIDLLAASVGSPPANSPDKAKSGRRPTKKDAIGNDKWQALDSEAPSRRRLAPEKKQQIENLLIEGIPVADIVVQMKVSNPTIYVIKARLKKEGRL
jgi:hypothetical protein